MSEVTIKAQAKRYKLTVEDAYLRFLTAEGTYAKEMHALDSMKSVQLAPDASTKKIYASGKVYDITTNVRGGKVTVDAVALPDAIVDEAHGAQGTGATVYDVSLPQGKEFGFGFSVTMSDGSRKYVWYPRCRLSFTNEESKTSDDSDIDPSESYEIECMPTSEGVWRVRYATADVAEGKKPFTPQEWFGKGLYTVAQITAATGSETASA